MTRIKLEQDDIKKMSTFQFITRVTPVDSYVWDDKIVFVVPFPKVGQCVGKQGVNIKKLEKTLQKKIKIVGLSTNIEKFLKSLLFPLEIAEITTEEEGEDNKKIYKLVTIQGKDKKTNGQIIGRDAKNLNEIKKITNKYFNVEEIKII